MSGEYEQLELVLDDEDADGLNWIERQFAKALDRAMREQQPASAVVVDLDEARRRRSTRRAA